MTVFDAKDRPPATEPFLPDFRSLACTLVLLLFGQVLALMTTLVAVPAPSRFWADLGLNSLFIMWIVLISQALLALLAGHLQRMRPLLAGVSVFVVATLVAGGLTCAAYALLPPADEYGWGATHDLLFQSLSHAVLAGLVVAVGLRYQYIQYLQRLQARAESTARLAALQSRMRPHFLFNSLNAIASLTRHNPALAEELILDLADLFRAILQKENPLNTVGDEIALSRQYLNIEQQRLGGRLQIAWNLQADTLDALLPALSLQPLLENAVLHGIEPLAEGGRIEIACYRHAPALIVLSVRNSAAVAAPTARRSGNGIALDNLRLRLQSVFGEAAKLTHSNSGDWYQAQIIIPYQTRHALEHSTG